jgi:hypothetical protein
MADEVAYYGKFQGDYVTKWLRPLVTFFNTRDFHGEVKFVAFASREEVDRRLAAYQERIIGVIGVLSCRLFERSAEDVLIMDKPGQPVHFYDDHRDELGRLVGYWE